GIHGRLESPAPALHPPGVRRAAGSVYPQPGRGAIARVSHCDPLSGWESRDPSLRRGLFSFVPACVNPSPAGAREPPAAGPFHVLHPPVGVRSGPAPPPSRFGPTAIPTLRESQADGSQVREAPRPLCLRTV